MNWVEIYLGRSWRTWQPPSSHSSYLLVSPCTVISPALVQGPSPTLTSAASADYVLVLCCNDFIIFLSDQNLISKWFSLNSFTCLGKQFWNLLTCLMSFMFSGQMKRHSSPIMCFVCCFQVRTCFMLPPMSLAIHWDFSVPKTPMLWCIQFIGNLTLQYSLFIRMMLMAFNTSMVIHNY